MESAAETYLQDFHKRRAGTTADTFLRFEVRVGQYLHASSYHLVAANVPDNALIVLDLCCGGGALLDLLARRSPAPELIGVDFSQYELAAARAILPASVALRHERAQSLGVPSGSIDYVVSHMALMLLENTDQVADEIARVLRAGGKLVAVVGRAGLLGGLHDVFVSHYRDVARDSELGALPIGDQRTRSAEGWAQILGRGFTDIRYEHAEVLCSITPDALWNDLLDTYDLDRLSASALAVLRTRFLRAVEPFTSTGGLVETGWGLALVSATVLHR